MPNPVFELFETICNEVKEGRHFTLTERSIPRTLANDLLRRFRVASFDDALQAAIGFLSSHFQEKGSTLPFTFDRNTGIVAPSDLTFINFVASVIELRTRPRESKIFENAACERLAIRLRAGTFHSIGWPRGTRTRLAEIVGYLETLGFDDDVLRGRDKDGGLDILWLPPLGTVPIRPIVSFQCKNSRFTPTTVREAHNSATVASRSIHRHSCMRSHGTYMSYVIFNDYLDNGIKDMAAGLSYAPLGLSDLATPSAAATVTLL